jgi:hypothetical protein
MCFFVCWECGLELAWLEALRAKLEAEHSKYLFGQNKVT